MSNLKEHIYGVLFTLIVGSILHFVYEWSGRNVIVAVFSPVNESIWEHLKLLFIPMFFFAIIEYFTYGKKLSNFVPIRVLSMLLGMIVIVVSFYTYSGIIGSNYVIADIVIFILGILVAYYFSFKLLQTEYIISKEANLLGWIGLILITFFFVLFTFMPPHIALFKDTVIGFYGIGME